MHWFWRAAIAYVCGILPVWGFFALAAQPGDLRSIAIWMMFTGFNAAVSGAVMLAVYDRLTYRYAAWRAEDDETRCRQCGYILRGITEPRCPECGERI